MSDTYTKLFRSIAASTIVSEPLATRWLWVTMLSQSDKAGKVYASVPGLARMANISLEDCEAGLACFLAPDRYSRTAEHEGRRIEPFDGGWRLLNHAKYDAMRSEAERREKKREWDRVNRASGWQREKAREAEADQSDASPTVRQEPDETRQSGPISHSSYLIPQQEQKGKNKPSPAATALPDPPAGVDEDAWGGFVAMRKRIRFPMTPRAATLIHKRLAELEALGNDPNAVLDQSTRNGWRDVFEIKSDKGNNHATPVRLSAAERVRAHAIAGELADRASAAAADRIAHVVDAHG